MRRWRIVGTSLHVVGVFFLVLGLNMVECTYGFRLLAEALVTVPYYRPDLWGDVYLDLLGLVLVIAGFIALIRDRKMQQARRAAAR
jgi:hypothetical protein